MALTTGGVKQGSGKAKPDWPPRSLSSWIMSGSQVKGCKRVGTWGVKCDDLTQKVPDGRTVRKFLKDMGYAPDLDGLFFPTRRFWKLWVSEQYRVLLDREPDRGGLEWWTDMQTKNEWALSEFRRRFRAASKR